MKSPTSSTSTDPQVFWRISIYTSLDGEGAAVGGGRWNTPGRPAVYLAESPAGAMLEVLAHLPTDEGELPNSFRLLRVEAITAIGVVELGAPAGEAWKQNERITRQIGDEWLESRETPLARVPSAIMPFTWNYLLNPLHPDAGQDRKSVV